jgi:DNA-binding response OmpR family regulator
MSVKVVMVVEDDPDVQFLKETIFSMDCRFSLGGVTASAEEAMDSLRTAEPGIIVLDHGLSGRLTSILGTVAGRSSSGPDRPELLHGQWVW